MSMNFQDRTPLRQPGANRQDAGAEPLRRHSRGRGREEHHHEHASDALAIRFAIAFAVISVLAVAWVQWFGGEKPPEALSPLAKVRLFTVADFPGGVVELRDAETQDLLARYDLGEGAFIRTSLRSLADARSDVAPGDESPFRLELRESGRLRLIDPITERTLELRAFGLTNAVAFQELLPQEDDLDPESPRADTGAPTVAQEATRSNTHER